MKFLKAIFFVGICLATLKISAMEPVKTSSSQVGDDWYTYGIQHGLGNPIKVHIPNRTETPLQIIFKKINAVAWDVFMPGKTLEAINDVTNKTAPFAAYIIRTIDSNVYLLDFDPLGDNAFSVTLYKSKINPEQINKLPIVHQLALSRVPVPLAQLVTNGPKEILDTQVITKGDSVYLTFENDGIYLTTKAGNKG